MRGPAYSGKWAAIVRMCCINGLFNSDAKITLLCLRPGQADFKQFAECSVDPGEPAWVCRIPADVGYYGEAGLF